MQILITQLKFISSIEMKNMKKTFLQQTQVSRKQTALKETTLTISKFGLKAKLVKYGVRERRGR